MQKFASDFSATNVITKEERLVVGKFKDFILNPENGTILGILIAINDHKKTAKTINIIDVIGLGLDFILIKNLGSLSNVDEIIRIKEVIDSKIKIVNSKVFSEDGIYFGRVKDFTINLEGMILERIYVRPASLINLMLEDIVISRNQIIKIEKDRITVKSGSVRQDLKYSKEILRSQKTPKTKTA